MKKKKLGFRTISNSRTFATTWVNWFTSRPNSKDLKDIEFMDVSRSEFAWTVEYKNFN